MESQPTEPFGGGVINVCRTDHMVADGGSALRVLPNGDSAESCLSEGDTGNHETSEAHTGECHNADRDTDRKSTR